MGDRAVALRQPIFDDHEFAQVLAGSVTITHENGSPQIFGAGDAFFIPAGARMRWTVPDSLRKFYTWVKA